MATEADYIKAAKEKGHSDDIIMQRTNNIKQLESQGSPINWQWHIDMLIKPFKIQ